MSAISSLGKNLLVISLVVEMALAYVSVSPQGACPGPVSSPLSQPPCLKKGVQILSHYHPWLSFPAGSSSFSLHLKNKKQLFSGKPQKSVNCRNICCTPGMIYFSSERILLQAILPLIQ